MSKYIVILIACMVFTSCKTRKVDLQTSDVSKQVTTAKNTTVHATDSIKATDNTTIAQQSHSEAINSSVDSTEFEADSAVVVEKPDGSKKTTIYIKPGTKVKNTSSKESNQKIDNTVNTAYDKQETNVKSLDSSVNKDKVMKSDSIGKTKHTDAVGSGTTWATYLSIGGAIIGCLIVWLLYLRFKK